MAVFPETELIREQDVRTPAQLLRALNGFIGPADAALRNGLTFKDNFAAHVRTVTVTPPDDWVILPLVRGWGSWRGGMPPQLRKSDDGWLEFRRLAKLPPTVPPPFTRFATFPPQYEAASDGEFAVPSNYAFAVVGNTATGLFMNAGGGPNGWVSLFGMRIEAADKTPLPWPTPITINLPDTFKDKPCHVLPLHAEETEGSIVRPLSCSGWSAKLDTATRTYRITIPRIVGLAPLRTYRVTLAVLAG